MEADPSILKGRSLMGAFSLAMPAWNLLPCDLRPEVGIHVRGVLQTSAAHLRDLHGLVSRAGPEQLWLRQVSQRPAPAPGGEWLWQEASWWGGGGRHLQESRPQGEPQTLSGVSGWGGEPGACPTALLPALGRKDTVESVW